MTILINNRTVLVALLFVSMTTNAQVGNGIQRDSASVSTPGYSGAYENAPRRKEELTNRENALKDSIRIWNKELKRLEGLHASIVRSNEMLAERIAHAEAKGRKSDLSELLKKRERLLTDISADEKEKASLDFQLQEVVGELEARNHQREGLRRIKDDVSNQIIAESKDYLDRAFSDMDLAELRQIRSECLKYAADAKVNAFVVRTDNVIKNKELYDNIVNVLNTAYRKSAVDSALSSITRMRGANMLQEKEISGLKNQLALFPDGLAAFKEFITSLNGMRNGVNYSMKYFQTDIKLIRSKNNLGNRIDSRLMRVPYLKKKFEEFMKAIKAAPNSHPNVETEILNQ